VIATPIQRSRLTDGSVLRATKHDRLENDVQSFHGHFGLSTLDRVSDLSLERVPLVQRANVEELEQRV
jgi:hypothetical protein